jgi:hypothetical protein
MLQRGLSPDEDAELRRLHFFRRFGTMAAWFSGRYGDLRGRDRRMNIRDPDERAGSGFFATRSER